mmetsp:Transcript_4570/g.3725  ORF Transcript_4570/g.3725 Transcript_4570/m.3725 type:complete len:118 (+) Transcript_4570:227-580(+)
MGLLVVLVSRWISLGEAALYTSLMILVLFLSIVTAFADSSLLALNSQYSPKMQEAMQIAHIGNRYPAPIITILIYAPVVTVTKWPAIGYLGEGSGPVRGVSIYRENQGMLEPDGYGR